MKRELLHESCNWKPTPITPKSNPFEIAEACAMGERVTRIRGKSRGSYHCDGCGGEIQRGDSIIALSVSTNNSPYFEWESDFVEAER